MAAQKKPLRQMEMFDEMSAHKLSPNQYYLLCSMRDSVTALRINMHLELRALKAEGWVTVDNQLTPKSIILIDKLESFFKVQKRKTSNQLMGKDYKQKLEQYREMFPNMKLPSGKAARSAVGNLEKNFRWFFDNHNYDWDTIMKATAHYLDSQEKRQWKFCRTSQYFIRKNDLSDLADYCEIVLTGGDADEKTHHATKVV